MGLSLSAGAVMRPAAPVNHLTAAVNRPAVAVPFKSRPKWANTASFLRPHALREQNQPPSPVKTVRFDEGFRFDDPNTYWGDPSYQLEPGDAGYVPDPSISPLQQRKSKKHTMPKSDYISQNDEAFSAQLNLFKMKIGDYDTTLGVSAPQVTAQAADADYFAYVLACQQIEQSNSQQWTAWKKLSRNGGTAPPAGMPMAPVFPTSVAVVPLGIEVRFRALVQLIKPHGNYNEAIGEALGIEGAEQTGPDLMTIQPEIEATIGGNRVEIDWGWGGQGEFLDLCEIQVERGAGTGFVLLTYDTTPGYTDTAPFPATPTKWTYRAIYRVGDQQVGQWSKPVSVTVGG
jgi:hypothetical protein